MGTSGGIRWSHLASPWRPQPVIPDHSQPHRETTVPAGHARGGVNLVRGDPLVMRRSGVRFSSRTRRNVQVRAVGRLAEAGAGLLRRGPYGDLGDVASDVEMPGRVERRPLTRSDAAEPVPNRPHHGRQGPHGACVGQAPRPDVRVGDATSLGAQGGSRRGTRQPHRRPTECRRGPFPGTERRICTKR